MNEESQVLINDAGELKAGSTAIFPEDAEPKTKMVTAAASGNRFPKNKKRVPPPLSLLTPPLVALRGARFRGVKRRAPYLLVREVPQFFVAKGQHSRPLVRNFRVDSVVVARALRQLGKARGKAPC